MTRPSVSGTALIVSIAVVAIALTAATATAEHTLATFVAAPWRVDGAAAATSSGAVRLNGGAVAAPAPPHATAAEAAPRELRADVTVAGAAADACVALWAVAAPFARGRGALCGGPARFAGVAAVVHNGTAALLVGTAAAPPAPACAVALPTGTDSAGPVHVRVRVVADPAGAATLRVAVGARDAPFRACTAAAPAAIPAPADIAATAAPAGPAVRLRALALVPAGTADAASSPSSGAAGAAPRPPQVEAVAALARRVETIAAAVRGHTAAEQQHHQGQQGQESTSSNGGGGVLGAALAELEADAARAGAAAATHGDAAEGAYRAGQRTRDAAARTTGAVRRYAALERALGGRRVSARMVAAHYGADRGTVALLAVLAGAAAAAAAFLWCHAHGLTDRLFHEKIY